MIQQAVERGKELGARVVAATFDPHPRAVLMPGTEPRLLSTLDVRRELLVRAGVDEVRVIRFDRELSMKSPKEFVDEVLVGELGARTVVVGENFRFGHRAVGDVKDLGRLMREHGGEVVPVALRLSETEQGISSSRIRNLISFGEVSEAAKLLGRAYTLRGEVVEGDHRGQQIGFPTANVLQDPSLVVPARGVYAGFVVAERRKYVACTNIGVAPTFDRRESKVEAHVLDFDGDLYGSVIDVGFTRRIREEKKFSGIEELKVQIGQDVEEARRIANGEL